MLERREPGAREDPCSRHSCNEDRAMSSAATGPRATSRFPRSRGALNHTEEVFSSRGGRRRRSGPMLTWQVATLTICVSSAMWTALTPRCMAEDPFANDPNEPVFPGDIDADPPSPMNLAEPEAIPDTVDMTALLAIRDALNQYNTNLIGEPPVTVLDGWVEGTNPCRPNATWFGLTCTATAPYRVIALDLEMSRLRGPIPVEIGSLSYLSSLKLDLNRFNGTIPIEISKLSNLRELDIEFNRISGPLPDWISHLNELRLIKAASNHLNGTIPTVLATLDQLTYLDLSSNDFTGTVPSLTLLWRLQHLLLTANELEGTLPDWLDELPNLREVSLRKNHFTGSIPNYQAALSLEHLYLGYNNISGYLPDTIGDLTALSTLFLPSNNLQGSIPVSFSNMSSLSLLDLSSNPELSGPLPDFLGNLDTLGLLQLTGCGFTGTIPSSLGFLTNVKEMYLDDNKLVGSIPMEIGNMSALTQLYLGGNRLNGSIPDSLCLLEDVVNIDLSGNTLTGDVPECLVKLPKLKSLVLTNNLLTGPVPAPDDPDLNFQYDKNCFPGMPDQLPSCAPDTWDSAPPLQGGDGDGGEPPGENPPGVEDGTEPPPSTDTGGDTSLQTSGPPSADPLKALTDAAAANSAPPGGGLPMWASVVLVIMAFFFLAFLSYTFFYSISSITKSVINRQDQLPVQEFSLSKIKKATKNFTTVYGRGSFGTVYLGEDFRKGHSEPRVIIKRATDPQKLGEFLFKCKVEVLARARHRYLVNLLGYCTGRGERILVYDYLPNGTLFDRLHRPELEPLPWDVRVRIAVSIACALEHLHHGLTPPLVHRAVTSSNILLAADMTAKLSDFGIARGSLGTAGTLDDTPRRRKARGGGPGGRGGGSTQESSATQGILQLEKVDVYGFGVVLLEVITGQKAMKEVHITSVAAPFLEDPQMMPLMVDPQLGGYFNQAELIELASIARDCVRDDPMARPSMRDVLQCMEDRLRLDANLFENTDVGDDMLTDGYSTSSAVTIGNPPHVRQGSTSSNAASSWAVFENFAAGMKSMVSPGHRLQMGGNGSQEDFEMSSLLVMSGAGSAANDDPNSRLTR